MWNPAVVDGPIAVPILGAPEPVGPLNAMVAPIIGFDSRYHLNIPADQLTDDLAAHAVSPAPPTRVIAGVATAFLRFADEAEARAALPDHWIDAPA